MGHELALKATHNHFISLAKASHMAMPNIKDIGETYVIAEKEEIRSIGKLHYDCHR